jgi:Ca2+:H+ antiporter
MLLGMGLSRFVGGIRHNVQRYNRAVAMTQSGLLLMAGAGLIVPAVFSFTTAEVTSEISDEISAVLFGLYAASLVFTLRTHKHYLAKGQVHPPAAASAAERTIHSKALESTPAWSPRTALVWLTVASLLLAALSEVLTDALAPAALRLGLSEIFTGIFLLAIVGNAAELMSATRFAAKDQMDLAVGSTLGAATQVALLVAPILIFGSHWLGHPMDLKFSQFEVISITIAIVISRQLSGDGESTWLEGLMLLAVYAILGIGFFYLRVGPA